MPTAAAIWLLTLSAIMADGRILTSHATYADEAHCRASGMITADRLQSSGVPTGYACTEVELESLTLEEALSSRFDDRLAAPAAEPPAESRRAAHQAPAEPEVIQPDPSPDFLKAGPTL